MVMCFVMGNIVFYCLFCIVFYKRWFFEFIVNFGVICYLSRVKNVLGVGSCFSCFNIFNVICFCLLL